VFIGFYSEPGGREFESLRVRHILTFGTKGLTNYFREHVFRNYIKSHHKTKNNYYYALLYSAIVNYMIFC